MQCESALFSLCLGSGDEHRQFKLSQFKVEVENSHNSLEIIRFFTYTGDLIPGSASHTMLSSLSSNLLGIKKWLFSGIKCSGGFPDLFLVGLTGINPFKWVI